MVARSTPSDVAASVCSENPGGASKLVSGTDLIKGIIILAVFASRLERVLEPIPAESTVQ